MAEVLLVNPRRRRRKSRRKMSAKQRMYFGGGRKRRRRSRASAAPRRRRRRAVAVHANPRRRRSRRSITRSFRRRRRNPSLRGIAGGVMPTLRAGFTGALGALGLDFLWGYGKQFLPATIAGSPIAQYATKLAGAIVVGMLANKLPIPFVRGKGRDLAVGAATVVLHDALKAQLQASFPTLQLGEYLTYAPTVGSMRRAGQMLDTGVGEYLSGLPNDGAGGTEDNMAYTGEWNSDGMNGYG